VKNRSPSAAAQELLSRRQAQQSLLKFIEVVAPDTIPARHHRLLLTKLEAVERGEIPRLMIFMPPGSAKSTYASILFPPWFLGRNPERSVIGASYAGELAERFGRRVRNLVGSTEFKRVFGFGLSGDSAAAGRWETEKGGEYYAAGVDAAVAGRRADLGIIDDPVKGRAEADSQTIRDRIWDWYKADFWPRLKPGGRIVLIMTRWHEDDLAGRLIAEQASGGEAWEVLSLPAEARAGDPLGRVLGAPLWPEWFRPEMFAEAKRDMRNWSALYQQEPTPESGDYFKAEWIRWYDEAPSIGHAGPWTRAMRGGAPPRETMEIYGASDYAVTAAGGDYTVHLVIGVDPSDDIYVLDLWRDQTASDVWVESALDLMERWRPIMWAEENAQIEKGVGPFLTKRQMERRLFSCYRKQFSSALNKATKAQSIRGRMAMGKVYFPKRAPWATDLVSELLRFPAGKNDDQVDVLSLVGRMLDDLIGGEVPPKEEDLWQPPTYQDVIDLHDERERRIAGRPRRI
jgi:predicted phage terminase large subunit-like protein